MTIYGPSGFPLSFLEETYGPEGFTRSCMIKQYDETGKPICYSLLIYNPQNGILTSWIEKIWDDHKKRWKTVSPLDSSADSLRT